MSLHRSLLSLLIFSGCLLPIGSAPPQAWSQSSGRSPTTLVPPSPPPALAIQMVIKARELFDPRPPDPTLLPVPTPVEPSTQSRQTYARQITVEISAPDTWGSGVIIQRQGSRYWVLTNDHVMRSVDTFTVKTADGQLHTGRRYPWPTLQGYDLGLMVFDSPESYRVAVFAPPQSLHESDRIYVAGFPAEPQIQNRESFELEEGRVALIADRTLKWGYQIGYRNNTVKGMSGGPVLNRYNQVVAIHGLGAYPLWGDPYTYHDGSTPPCEPLWDAMYQLNWGIPVDQIAQIIPNTLTIASAPPVGTEGQSSNPPVSQFPWSQSSPDLSSESPNLSATTYDGDLDPAQTLEELETNSFIAVAKACLPVLE